MIIKTSITTNHLAMRQTQNHKVLQYPSNLLINPEENHQLHCNHSITDYFTILWYKQSTGDSSLNLIGYIYYKKTTVESSFEDRFGVFGDGAKYSTLHLNKSRAAEDSAVYYCAASQCYTHSLSSTKTPLITSHTPVFIHPFRIKKFKHSLKSTCILYVQCVKPPITKSFHVQAIS
uniref:Immunoglobulin V-set domain-containing protein n=1 Tax=Astyanax mexicanus TaxID=7994 RepID=A0A8B9L3J0_ASTMX